MAENTRTDHDRDVPAQGQPLEYGPRQGDWGGDFGWSFEAQDLETDDHVAEHEWIAKTIQTLSGLLAKMATECRGSKGEASGSE